MVYYRWHPLSGQQLRVQKRQKDRHGEYIFVRLPDDTTSGLPAWMFRPECAEFIVGSPLISIDALSGLRDLLTVLRPSPPCGKALLRTLSKEDNDEISAEANTQSAKSSTTKSRAGNASDRQGQRTRSRAGRTSNQRGKQRKRRRTGSTRRRG